MLTPADVYDAMPYRSELYDVGGRTTIVLTAGTEFGPKAVAFWEQAVPPGWEVLQREAGVIYLQAPASATLSKVTPDEDAALHARLDNAAARADSTSAPMALHDPADSPLACIEASLWEINGAGPKERTEAVQHAFQALAALLRHLPPDPDPRIPLLVHDDSLAPDPRGYRAWSYEGPNDKLPHPLAVGSVVWTRDLDPDETEYLALVHTVEEHHDRFRYWTYWLLPVGGLVHAAGVSIADPVLDPSSDPTECE